MANILLLGSGTQAFAILRSLHKACHKIVVLVRSKGNYADASRFVDKCIAVGSSAMNDDDLLGIVIKVIHEERIDVILPAGDLTAEFVSKFKEQLMALTHIVAPDYECFMNGYDKNRLMRLCRNHGFPHPQTLDMSEATTEDLCAFPYPALLKPNCTTGGRGMVLVHDYEQLKNTYPQIHKDYGDCHLQRFIKEGGKQVKVQLCVDTDGTLLQHSVLHKVRWFPVKGGASCCAVSIEDEKMVTICHQILQEINWVGFADFDTIEDPNTGELLIMEINPRLPACIGAAIHAGIDWGNILVNQALGLPQKDYSYKTGVTLRHLGFDILWFKQSSKRFNTRPSWFKFIGRDVYYQDFDFTDQKPFWIGTYHNIKKLFDPSFKKAKSGTSAI